MSALVLGGCWHVCRAESPRRCPNFLGDWKITKEIDSVAGAKLVSILIYSHKLSHSGLSFAGRFAVQFACLKGQPSIQFVFGFQIGSKADSETAYRFDEQREQLVEVHILRGLSVAVIEDKKEVEQFLTELASANLLYLVIKLSGQRPDQRRVSRGGRATWDRLALSQLRVQHQEKVTFELFPTVNAALAIAQLAC
jgi:hypothetical protein